MPDAIERAAEEDNKHVIQSPTVSEKVNSDLESVKEPEPELGFIHPHKWSTWKKWSNILAVSYCDFLTYLTLPSPHIRAMLTFLRFAVSMMLAPTIPQVLETFGGARALGSFSVTVYILGFCFGPLLLGPLSDVYGRTLLLRICITLFLILTAACALSTSLAMLIAFRFFAGIFGGAPMAIGGAVISDLYPSGSLGRPMAAYSFGTMMGPTIGPVLGSVINGSLGWRWVFWFASILVRITGTSKLHCECSLLLLGRSLCRWPLSGAAGDTSAYLEISSYYTCQRETSDFVTVVPVQGRQQRCLCL